jgi:hypothetical protein
VKKIPWGSGKYRPPSQLELYLVTRSVNGDVGSHGAGIMSQTHTDFCPEASVTSRLIRRHPSTNVPWLGRNAHTVARSCNCFDDIIARSITKRCECIRSQEWHLQHANQIHGISVRHYSPSKVRAAFQTSPGIDQNLLDIFLFIRQVT